MFLINKKITVDKPLTGIISKYDKALLQFTTASLILQITTTCYYI